MKTSNYFYPIVVSVSLLGGCASMTPTYTNESGFVILDVKGQSINRNALLGDVTSALQKHVSSMTINRSIPPTVLPTEPGRFQVMKPFSGTAMAGAFNVGNFTIANCENALFVGTTQTTGMAMYGERSSFTVCVYQYKAGYSVNIYVSSQEATGGFSAEVLSATMTKSFLGGSNQFIPKAIEDVKTSLSKYGKVTEVDSYIPESYTGVFNGSKSGS